MPRNEKQMVVIVLSLCPAVVASTRVIDALWLAAGVVVVLAAMSFLLPLLRAHGGSGPEGDRSPGLAWGALLLSSCVTALFELALNALAPAVASRLGIYVPLIAVSILTVGRPDALAAAGPTPLDAARTAAWFTAILVTISVIREVLGSGTITLGSTIPVAPFFADPARAAGFAGGALICLGYAAGAVRLLTRGAPRDDGEAG